MHIAYIYQILWQARSGNHHFFRFVIIWGYHFLHIFIIPDWDHHLFIFSFIIISLCGADNFITSFIVLFSFFFISYRYFIIISVLFSFFFFYHYFIILYRFFFHFFIVILSFLTVLFSFFILLSLFYHLLTFYFCLSFFIIFHF